MSKITLHDDALAVDITFSTNPGPNSGRVGSVACLINNQTVDLTDEQFRLIVDGLMDVRAILADVKAKVPAVES